MDNHPAACGEVDYYELAFSEQFVLWSWRIWVLGLYRDRPAVPVIDRACAVLGAPGGGALIDRMMMVLADNARRPIDIRPPCYRTLSDDERRLLGAVRYLQDGDAVRPLFLLSPLLKAERREAVHAAIGDVARLLMSAGVDLTAVGAAPSDPFSLGRRTRCDA